jgi:hypothetical protein
MNYDDDHELPVGEDFKQDGCELIQCTLNSWLEGLVKFTKDLNENK